MAQITTSEHANAPLVSGPSRLAVSYGLFSVLGFETPAEPHWQQGARWEDIVSNEVGILGMPSCDPEIPNPDKDFQEGGSNVEHTSAFTLYGSYKCSPFGNPISRAGELAQLRLQNLEEREVEKVLWDKLASVALAFPDLPILTSLTSTLDDLLEAVALLEQHIADEYGALGVIHLNRYNGTRLHKALGLEFRGGRAYTPLGTPVVIGQGYGSDAIVATGPLFGIRSEISQPYQLEGALLDMAQNDLYAIVERTYLIGFDQAPATRVELSSTTP